MEEDRTIQGKRDKRDNNIDRVYRESIDLRSENRDGSVQYNSWHSMTIKWYFHKKQTGNIVR
jgi:hypothetical protein